MSFDSKRLRINYVAFLSHPLQFFDDEQGDHQVQLPLVVVCLVVIFVSFQS